jgi:hypothetical protein
MGCMEVEVKSAGRACGMFGDDSHKLYVL